jgi:uncharacterized protein YehS (DUF1456 family)
MDFEGVEASNFRDTLLTADNKNATENDVEQWLKNDEGDLGYQIFSVIEIAENVLHGKQEDDDDDKDEESVAPHPKLSVIRQHMDDINYIESSSDPDVLPYYEHF